MEPIVLFKQGLLLVVVLSAPPLIVAVVVGVLTSLVQAPIDYDHYVTRQLQPVADAILPFVDDDFSTLVGGQMGLF